MSQYISYDDSRFCTFSHSPHLPDLRSPQTHSTPLPSHLVVISQTAPSEQNSNKHEQPKPLHQTVGSCHDIFQY